MTRLLAAAALAISFTAGTVAPASANHDVCDPVNWCEATCLPGCLPDVCDPVNWCVTTCLPGCLPDVYVGCFHLDPYARFCL